jgi:hypothetical protein
MTGFWDQVFEINNINRIASVNNFLVTKPFIILQEGLRVWTVFPSKLHLVFIIWYQVLVWYNMVRLTEIPLSIIYSLGYLSISNINRTIHAACLTKPSRVLMLCLHKYNIVNGIFCMERFRSPKYSMIVFVAYNSESPNQKMKAEVTDNT